MSPEGLLELLCGVARLDSPIHGHALLHQVADLLSIPPARYAATAAPVAALPR